MSVVGIVPAAGSGERLGSVGPKAFVVCGGRPLIEWSLDALRSVCDRVVVAAPEGYEDPARDFVRGGAVRSESVRQALLTAPEATVAVVHDAARPLVTPALAQACIETLAGATDDAALVEAAGGVVRVVESPPEHIKVTRPVDVKLAEMLLAERAH